AERTPGSAHVPQRSAVLPARSLYQGKDFSDTEAVNTRSAFLKTCDYTIPRRDTARAQPKPSPANSEEASATRHAEEEADRE
ncbi:unnamed protein product, partial [Laminaria digitata]